MTDSSLPITIGEIRGTSRRSRDDRVAVEEPLEIRLGYETADGRTENSVSITMRTPGDAAQKTFDETGGLHAAAAFNTTGELIVTHEDVGRHNAVDKVVGTLLSRGLLPANDLGLIVSGRASFELMQKTLMAGMPILAAVSAPSSLAVELAREFNVTLVGFLRGETFNIYAAEERIS
jgi:FdhD protein